MTDKDKHKKKWFNVKVQWTSEMELKLRQLTQSDPINWEEVSKELKVRQMDCKFKYAQITDQPWTREEENDLREWWEYHDKDQKLDFTEIEKTLNQTQTKHNQLQIKAKLQLMTKYGIYRTAYQIDNQ